VYEFERLGLTATDDEVYAGMMGSYPQFFQNGQLVAKEQLEQALAQQGMTLQDSLDQQRADVILSKVQNVLYESSFVSPKEIDQELINKFEKARIEYIAFPPAKFKDQVKVTPEQIKAYFDTHRFQYMEPEKRSFQVLVVDQDKVASSVNVTEAQLHAAYSQSMDNFRIPERVHVRHILIKTTDKSDAEKKQLLAKAQDILKQVKNGGNFAELATKNSDDPGSAAKGGDLGWVVKGQMVPEFEKACFSLKPAEIGDIVTTTYGYHIVQVLEREPARIKPFDEVKAQLADDMKKEGLSDKVQSLGDQVHAALEKNPGAAAEIAKQYGVDLVTVTNAMPGGAIPTLGVSPEIDSALASMKKNDVSPVLVLPANRLAVVVLNDQIPSRQSDLSEAEAKVRDKVIDDEAGLLATKKANEAAEKLKGGADINQVAKSMKLDVVQSVDFTHTDSVEGLGQAAFVGDAFTKPVGSVVGPVVVQGRNVVFKILDQQHPDPSKLTQERAAILDQLKKRKAISQNSLFLDSVYTQLVADGKVKKYPAAIKRLIASFR
jgi:peptidyl-prolyl cis-trans isomerase D